jgi:hypothetical protein
MQNPDNDLIARLIIKSRHAALRHKILTLGSRGGDGQYPPRHLGGVNTKDPDFLEAGTANEKPSYYVAPCDVTPDEYPDFPMFYCQGDDQ